MAEHSKAYIDLNKTLGFVTALKNHFSGSVLFESIFVEMEESIQNALELLKSTPQCENRIRLEELQELASESLKLIESQSEVIRCKDCKHRPSREFEGAVGFALEFPDNRCPCQCDDGYYSWYPNDNWYCADGERKEQTDDSGKV